MNVAIQTVKDLLLLSRLWQHVTGAIVNQDQELATQEKFVLEEAQRQEARQRGNIAWTPRLFTLDSTTNEWRYKHAEYVLFWTWGGSKNA